MLPTHYVVYRNTYNTHSGFGRWAYYGTFDTPQEAWDAARQVAASGEDAEIGRVESGCYVAVEVIKAKGV